jgi:hypothetical protein
VSASNLRKGAELLIGSTDVFLPEDAAGVKIHAHQDDKEKEQVGEPKFPKKANS